MGKAGEAEELGGIAIYLASDASSYATGTLYWDILCITCVNDKGCTLSRKFPVLQCEEFTNYESRPLKAKRRKKIKKWLPDRIK